MASIPEVCGRHGGFLYIFVLFIYEKSGNGRVVLSLVFNLMRCGNSCFLSFYLLRAENRADFFLISFFHRKKGWENGGFSVGFPLLY